MKQASGGDLSFLAESDLRFRELIQMVKTQIHYEFFRQVHEFGKFSENDDNFNSCYVLQVLAKPGKHSIILFEPKFGKWYCREVFIDTSRGVSAIGPEMVDSDDEDEESVTAQQFEPQTSQDTNINSDKILSFLNDMQPFRLD